MAVSQNLNILLIDETKNQIMSVKEILANTGFKKINYAFCGKSGLEKLTQGKLAGEPYQLIICNYEMKSMNGVQVFDQIKKEAGLSNTPFLLLCGNSDKSNILNAIQSGIRNILLRPFSKQSLINELVKMLH